MTLPIFSQLYNIKILCISFFKYGIKLVSSLSVSLCHFELDS